MNATSVSTLVKREGTDAIIKWLQAKNSKEEWPRVVERFKLSLAAYCVSTYVFGTANYDKLMVSGIGQVFQNDLTIVPSVHERKLFKLTPEISKMIGSPGQTSFIEFTSLAKKAYNILRKNSAVFVTAFDVVSTSLHLIWSSLKLKSHIFAWKR